MHELWRLSIWVALVSAPPNAAEGQTARSLPPLDYWPRDPQAYRLKEEQREREGGPSLPDDPQLGPLFNAVRVFNEDLQERLQARPSLDEESAEEIVEVLYRDFGDPIINSCHAGFMLILLDSISAWPEERLPVRPRHLLVDGLLEYISLGGMQCMPSDQADAAEVLYRLGFDRPDALAEADALLADAIVWKSRVSKESQKWVESVVKHYARPLWGELARWRVYELTMGSALPPRPPKRYQEAVRKLAELLTEKTADEDLFLKHVRQATQAALEPYADVNLRNDLLCRLLIVYRTLLERQPPIPEKVSEYIQEQLARLAVGQRRLTTERHWEFWSDAAAAVGKVRGRPMSEPLREALLRAASDERTPLGARQRLELAFDLETLKSGPSSAPSAP